MIILTPLGPWRNPDGDPRTAGTQPYQLPVIHRLPDPFVTINRIELDALRDVAVAAEKLAPLLVDVEFPVPTLAAVAQLVGAVDVLHTKARR